MTRTITFNELRSIKDRLPDGTIHRIAEDLGVTVVRITKTARVAVCTSSRVLMAASS